MIGKTVNPQWNIPESIRQEHIARARRLPRTFIPGGAPDNPLGKYRLELTLPMYRIHGTDIPWGVGMQVSHGCVRLYPEDIERLFPQVPIGTPGRVHLPDGQGRPARTTRVYVEAHEDIYGKTPAIFREAMTQLAPRGRRRGVDPGSSSAGLDDARRPAVPGHRGGAGQRCSLEHVPMTELRIRTTAQARDG